MSPLPIPDLYDQAAVSTIHQERGGAVAKAARAWADRHDIPAASDDDPSIAVFAIDCQIGFCHPKASLAVPGAPDDMDRAIRWLYRNLNRISHLTFSMDTHEVHQIFHPAWWEDADGNPPPPFTPIRAEDVEAGRWRPRRDEAKSLAYCRKLEEGGKYVLTIWPYHTLLGGVSHALVPALMEAAIFWSVARDRQPEIIAKGRHPLTENYSVFAPEVTNLKGNTLGSFNDSLFERLMAHDRIYVFGEAKSHCVLATLLDLRNAIEERRSGELEKVHILTDAMSPVPAPDIDPLPPDLDYPARTEEKFRELEAAGMRLVTTEEAIEA